jgi:tetratricopeptide (TPR) repeat protein
MTVVDSAIALYPSSDVLWALKGMFDKYLKNYEYSLLEYETAIRLAPDDPDYWYFRSNVLQALERFPEALSSADSAIVRDRENVVYWNKRAFLLYLMNRYRESLAATDSAVKYYKENHRYSYSDSAGIDLPQGKAVDVWSNGELQATITSDTVISRADETTPFWGVRAKALMALGRYEEAIEFFDSSLAEEPSATGYWLDRATCFMKIHRFEDAAYSVDSAQKYNEDPEEQKDIQYMRQQTAPSVRDSVGK